MLGLYIHIPFCSKKCYYCDFASYVNLDYLIDEYIDSLLLELDLHRDKKFNTIFIGGGTPSYLSEKQLEKLLMGISQKVDMNNIFEFTIESNPGTLNMDKLRVMKDHFVNRLSIGVQSANEDTLKFIGRIHSFNDFDKSINNAHKAGFTNINADVIFGIPNEKLFDYKNTLNLLMKYDLTHISAYNLILEENTKFYSMYEKGDFSELDEDTQIKMYSYTKDFLESNDFIQYEISNYSKKNKMCLHNLIYWNFQEYVGVGISAHSFYKGKRFENTRNINDYLKMLKQKNHKYENVVINSLNDNIEEYIIVGFRKIEGISIDDFRVKFDKDIFDIFGNIIKKNESLKLIEVREGRIFLTPRGFMLMNVVLEGFIK